MNKQTKQFFLERVRDELELNLLPFWLRHSVDRERGGFIGELSDSLQVARDAGRGLVLNARLLWTFSAIAGYNQSRPCLELADRAWRQLRDGFWDSRFGGAYWALDSFGKPAVTLKKTYGQSFVIYGLAEYYRLVRQAEALRLAIDLFRLIEAHACDVRAGGYFEVFTEDWRYAKSQRLSEEDPEAPKSMNTHLHLVEAYTHLYSVWSDPLLKARLRELVRLFLDRIIDPVSGHFQLFFDAFWKSLTRQVSFGHDIEGSWLLCRAAEALGDPVLQEETIRAAVRIAEVVLSGGLNANGGLIYGTDDDGTFNPESHFWCQAEAVVGFLNGYQLSGRERFLEAAWRVWRFIEDYQADRQQGEWFWKLDAGYRPDRSMPKVSEWKCPYHNSRACLETMQRLKELMLEPIERKRAILVYDQPSRQRAGDPGPARQIPAVDSER